MARQKQKNAGRDSCEFAAGVDYSDRLVRESYRSSDSTFCGLLLAIPNTDVPDCTRI